MVSDGYPVRSAPKEIDKVEKRGRVLLKVEEEERNEERKKEIFHPVLTIASYVHLDNRNGRSGQRCGQKRLTVNDSQGLPTVILPISQPSMAIPA
ncbi:hypothetical protein AC578_7803 [Pseudocercospora eumusae]|uniref:Uncharacterized protein n=1 Tax=Pseudocercospora eumusae TaxID=321146 RepID=A0A139GW37_9PEZI|nr:hypothetical protein AC578_7803 [Pseudocercospora eumusae]